MKKKKILLPLLSMLLITLSLTSCDPRTYDWRLNVKDGDNLNNDGGFGRFYEHGSPILRQLAAQNSAPLLGIRILNPDKYNMYTGYGTAKGFQGYGRQGHSNKEQLPWTVDQMKAAVAGGSVGTPYSEFDPKYFYKVVNGKTLRLLPNTRIRVTGSTSGKGNGNVDVQLVSDPKQTTFNQLTWELPNVNN